MKLSNTPKHKTNLYGIFVYKKFSRFHHFGGRWSHSWVKTIKRIVLQQTILASGGVSVRVNVYVCVRERGREREKVFGKGVCMEGDVRMRKDTSLLAWVL